MTNTTEAAKPFDPEAKARLIQESAQALVARSNQLGQQQQQLAQQQQAIQGELAMLQGQMNLILEMRPDLEAKFKAEMEATQTPPEPNREQRRAAKKGGRKT